MIKRAALVFLGVAVLSAWGMPFHPPCCGFRGTNQTPSVDSNCCPIEGCAFSQARGAAPASIADGRPLDTSLAAVDFGMTIGSVPLPGLSDFSALVSSRSSPPRVRPTSARLSVFRI